MTTSSTNPTLSLSKLSCAVPARDSLAGISQVLFVNSAKVGILVLVCCLQNPNMALAGILAIVSVFLFAAVCGLKIDQFTRGYWIYNPLLVGLSIGYIFRLDLKVVGLIVVMSILTILVTTFLESLLVSRGVPLLSLPFAVVSISVYLVAHGYGKLFSLALYEQAEPAFVAAVPIAIAAFFRALGTIVFSPTVLTGLLIFSVLAWFSRILAVQAIVCFYVGAFMHSCLAGSLETALTSPYGFNYILVGLAIVTFLKPSLRTYTLAILSVCVCVFFVDVTSRLVGAYQIPVFTLPFNIAVILLMLTMRRSGYPEQNAEIRATPEESLSAALVNNQRFKIGEPTIGLPFEGACSVYQGWDGEWTHQGKWRHAVDFVRCNPDGTMCNGSGKNLGDYLVFGMDVLAPVEGYVVSCCDHLADNAIGQVDHVNNWGNYIILRSTDGVHVELSHLMAHSLLVKPGDYVVLGQPLGKCGSSGLSPMPHLHLQVQRSGFLGEETIPFNFAIYHCGEDLKLRDCPEKDDVIEAVQYSEPRQLMVTMPLGRVFEFDIERNGRADTCRFRVCRTPDLAARTYLQDEHGSRLYFGILHGSFRFYDFRGSNRSALHLLYMAMPSLPLVQKTEFEWQETLPVELVCRRSIAQLRLFIASFWPPSTCPTGNWRCTNDIIRGVIWAGRSPIRTHLQFAADGGIEEIQVGNTKLTSTGARHHETHNSDDPRSHTCGLNATHPGSVHLLRHEKVGQVSNRDQDQIPAEGVRLVI